MVAEDLGGGFVAGAGGVGALDDDDLEAVLGGDAAVGVADPDPRAVGVEAGIVEVAGDQDEPPVA